MTSSSCRPATASPGSPDAIRRAFERNARAVKLRPSVGQGTAVTRVRLREGLACEVEEGPWRLAVDMGEKHGGTGSAPNPGVLGRGALGACLAIGYAQWAALRGVALRSVEVEVQADYDGRGTFAVAPVSPGYSQVRYVVTVDTDAPEEEIVALLDDADAASSWRDVFAHAVDLRREVRLRGAAPAEEAALTTRDAVACG